MLPFGLCFPRYVLLLSNDFFKGRSFSFPSFAITFVVFSSVSRYSIPPASPKSPGSRYSMPIKSESPVYTIQQTPLSYMYDEAAPHPTTQNLFNAHLQSSVYVHSPNHAYYRDGEIPSSMYTSTPNTQHTYNDSMYASNPTTQRRYDESHMYASRIPPGHAYNSPDVTHAYNDDTQSSQLYFLSNQDQADHVCWRKNQRWDSTWQNPPLGREEWQMLSAEDCRDAISS